MKTLFLFLALLMSLTAVGQNSKTFGETFLVSSASILITPANLEVEYKEIEGSRLIVETTIESSAREAIIDFIIANGLISPQVSINEFGEANLTYPNQDKLNALFIKGVQIESKIKITIYMPKAMKHRFDNF